MANGVNRADILNSMQVGFWVIEYPDDGKPRMYTDEMMRSIMGAAPELSPEELHEFWFTRIDSNYISMVQEAVNKLKKNYTTEVRYPWEHPTQGWRFVRCGAYRDESFENGIRLKGFHKDVTEQMEMEVREDNKHEIIDLKKLKIYSSYFVEMCEEAFEIDVNTFKIKSIFHKKGRYSKLQEECDVFSAIDDVIYPEDREQIRNIFSEKELLRIIKEEKMAKAEFRTKMADGGYGWVEGRLFYVDVGGLKKLLLITYDIESKKKVSLLKEEKEQILDAFINMCKAIIEVDLNTQELYILKTIDGNGGEEADFSITLKNMSMYLRDRLAVDFEKKELQEFLSIEHLRKMAADKTEGTLDLRFQREDKYTIWLQMRILYLPQKDDKIYIVFANAEREHILNSIAEKFVYKNSDYFYYLDLKHDYYIRYFGNEKYGTLPPQEGWDYREEIVRYTMQYAHAEDCNNVIEAMQPEYMIRRLDQEGEYHIFYGTTGNKGEYRRKQLIFRYYDEENKIVLVQRNDITKEYAYRKKQEKKLVIAEWEASNDALTGVYNRAGGIRLIKKGMHEHQSGAFLVIDLDNFKKVNDCMGHLKGDEVLRNCGQTLKENLRASDIIVRIGGDEFAVFLKDAKNKENVRQCVKNLIEKLQTSYIEGNEKIQVSASIGVALVPGEGSRFEELYAKADKALYEAKARGKGGYFFFEDGDKYEF